MASTITVEWTSEGLLRVEISAGVAQDLHNCIHHGPATPEVHVLEAMLADRLDKPRREDAKTQTEPQSPGT